MADADNNSADKQARADALAQRLVAIGMSSPWWTLAEAAAYEKRPKRWLANEAKHSRVRCAYIGGKRQLFFRREWLDEHLSDMATPIVMPARRRA